MNHLPSHTAEVQLTTKLRLNTVAAVGIQHSYYLVSISFVNLFSLFETNSIFLMVINVRVQPSICFPNVSGLLSQTKPKQSHLKFMLIGKLLSHVVCSR